MQTKVLQTTIDRQVKEAAQQYELANEKLKFSTHLFKPDSPKLETFVAVDIGWNDKKTNYMTSIRYFYSPERLKYPSASKLKSVIETYLKRKQLKPL